MLKKKLQRKTCVFRVYVMQVCEVLGGRNWVQDTDENKPPFLRDGGEGRNSIESIESSNRLDHLPLEDVLEQAERVIEVRFFFLFFCRSLTPHFSFFFCRGLAQTAECVIEERGCGFFSFFFHPAFFSFARRNSFYTEML